MKITFLGVNASGYYSCWGHHFPCGEPVEVDDEAVIEQARNHPEFKVDDLSDPHNVPSATEETLVKAAKKFDHDGDGKPGGSRPKVQRKPRRKAVK